MSEPNILVERHYIPLSVYMEIYGNTSNNTGSNFTNIPGNTTTSNTNYNYNVTQSLRNRNNSRNEIGSTRRTTRRNPLTSTVYRFETMTTPETTTSDVNLLTSLLTAFGYPTNSNTRSHGLTPDQIEDNTTTFTFSNNHTLDNTVCSICTLEYSNAQIVRRLGNCRHYFHSSCIDRWLEEHNNCPLCRSAVITNNTNNTSNNTNTNTTSRTNNTTTTTTNVNNYSNVIIDDEPLD